MDRNAQREKAVLGLQADGELGDVRDRKHCMALYCSPRAALTKHHRLGS